MGDHSPLRPQENQGKPYNPPNVFAEACGGFLDLRRQVYRIGSRRHLAEFPQAALKGVKVGQPVAHGVEQTLQRKESGDHLSPLVV
jgi:hypothetical protein